MKDIKMYANTIKIPLEIIKQLRWANNDTVLRLQVEDGEFLMIGKVKSHDEVVEAINKIIPPQKPAPKLTTIKLRKSLKGLFRNILSGKETEK